MAAYTLKMTITITLIWSLYTSEELLGFSHFHVSLLTHVQKFPLK